MESGKCLKSGGKHTIIIADMQTILHKIIAI